MLWWQTLTKEKVFYYKREKEGERGGIAVGWWQTPTNGKLGCITVAMVANANQRKGILLQAGEREGNSLTIHFKDLSTLNL